MSHTLASLIVRPNRRQFMTAAGAAAMSGLISKGGVGPTRTTHAQSEPAGDVDWEALYHPAVAPHNVWASYTSPLLTGGWKSNARGTLFCDYPAAIEAQVIPADVADGLATPLTLFSAGVILPTESSWLTTLYVKMLNYATAEEAAAAASNLAAYGLAQPGAVDQGVLAVDSPSAVYSWPADLSGTPAVAQHAIAVNGVTLFDLYSLTPGDALPAAYLDLFAQGTLLHAAAGDASTFAGLTARPLYESLAADEFDARMRYTWPVALADAPGVSVGWERFEDVQFDDYRASAEFNALLQEANALVSSLSVSYVLMPGLPYYAILRSALFDSQSDAEAYAQSFPTESQMAINESSGTTQQESDPVGPGIRSFYLLNEPPATPGSIYPGAMVRGVGPLNESTVIVYEQLGESGITSIDPGNRQYQAIMDAAIDLHQQFNSAVPGEAVGSGRELLVPEALSSYELLDQKSG